MRRKIDLNITYDFGIPIKDQKTLNLLEPPPPPPPPPVIAHESGYAGCAYILAWLLLRIICMLFLLT